MGDPPREEESALSDEDSLSQAIRHFQSSMALFQDEDDRANTLVEIASIYGEQGDALRAVELIDLALLRLQSFPNRQRAHHLRRQITLSMGDAISQAS